MFDTFESAFRLILSLGLWSVLLGGVVVCIVHRQLTPWSLMIAFGLIGMIALGVLQQGLMIALSRQMVDHAAIRYGFMAIGVFNAGAWLIVIAGLSLSFRDIQHRMNLLVEMAGSVR